VGASIFAVLAIDAVVVQTSKRLPAQHRCWSFSCSLELIRYLCYESWLTCHHEIVTERDIGLLIRSSRIATVAEWRQVGFTAAELRALVRSGELVRVWHGVYATKRAIQFGRASPAAGHATRVAAVRAATGRDGIASHRSAALIHGIDLFPDAPDVVTLTRQSQQRRNRRSEGIVFHTAALPGQHVTQKFGQPVTTVARTVVDIARTSSFMSAVVTADSALRVDAVSKEAMLRVCDACPRWPGIHKARRVISFADQRSGSVLESRARVVFDEHGIEPPELQKTITGPDFRYTVDFYWDKYRVIAETDGALKYADPRKARQQLLRDQKLRDANYKVVHFTWAEFFANAAPVIKRLRAAFAAPTAY
jgi:predicted transcriptional regulator of viral defense system